MGVYSPSLQNKYAHFSLSVPTLIKITCALPLFAALISVLWSLAFNFDGSTRTHCKVYNFLPTISSVTGGFTPQRYIWQICIALHAPQRLMMAVAYYGFHTTAAAAAVQAGSGQELYKAAAALNSLLHVVEVVSLVGLSMITSTDNYTVHKTLFILFMSCAVLYMSLTIVLMRWGRFGKHAIPSHQDRRSVKFKSRLLTFHLSVFAAAIYLFYRHNTYCEPGVYSLFALCEYLLIISNIAYHGMAIVDFEFTEVSVADIFSRRGASVGMNSYGSHYENIGYGDGYGQIDAEMRMV